MQGDLLSWGIYKSCSLIMMALQIPVLVWTKWNLVQQKSKTQTKMTKISRWICEIQPQEMELQVKLRMIFKWKHLLWMQAGRIRIKKTLMPRSQCNIENQPAYFSGVSKRMMSKMVKRVIPVWKKRIVSKERYVKYSDWKLEPYRKTGATDQSSRPKRP